MIEYLVVDLLTDTLNLARKSVNANSPERAAELVLVFHLVRSGAIADLRARVYSQRPGQALSMVRLYTKVADRQPA